MIALLVANTHQQYVNNEQTTFVLTVCEKDYHLLTIHRQSITIGFSIQEIKSYTL